MNVGYNGLFLSMFWTFKDQIGKNALEEGNYPGKLANQPVTIIGHEWQFPGDIATVARYSNQVQSSDYYFKNESTGAYSGASFARLSNLSLSYNLPAAYIKKINAQSCALFVHANNLFIITNYKGLDPELQNFGAYAHLKQNHHRAGFHCFLKMTLNMRLTHNIASILGLTACIYSCNKLVQIQQPTNTITTSETFSNPANATSAITAIYSQMSWDINSPCYSNGATTICAGLAADELNVYGGNFIEFQTNVIPS